MCVSVCDFTKLSVILVTTTDREASFWKSRAWIMSISLDGRQVADKIRRESEGQGFVNLFCEQTTFQPLRDSGVERTRCPVCSIVIRVTAVGKLVQCE